VQIVAVILAFALLAIVLFVVSGPLRAPAPAADAESDAAALDRGELEAAREAKYREIRDAELDRRTGKLSAGDYEAIDAALRAEALEILNRLQALEQREAATAEQATRAEAAESDAS
jgi:hypothetical protein